MEDCSVPAYDETRGTGLIRHFYVRTNQAGQALCCVVAREGKPLEGLTAAELEDILAFANRAASITCSRSGAIPAMPTLAEIQ